MSDCESVYGDDCSIAESVASLLHEELEEEEKKKKLQIYSDTNDTVEEGASYDVKDLFEAFKSCIFQDVSNDKLYIIELKSYIK